MQDAKDAKNENILESTCEQTLLVLSCCVAASWRTCVLVTIFCKPVHWGISDEIVAGSSREWVGGGSLLY